MQESKNFYHENFAKSKTLIEQSILQIFSLSKLWYHHTNTYMFKFSRDITFEGNINIGLIPTDNAVIISITDTLK